MGRLSNDLLLTLTRSLTRAHTLPKTAPRVLVVDDEPGVRAFLLRSMALVDCEIVVATSGADAIVVFERAAPITLLLSDLMMPGMNGLELGRRLQERTPDLKVLYLTGYSDALFAERPILGANEAYVDKPISPRGLHEAISLALYGHLHGLNQRASRSAPMPAMPSRQQTAWV